MTKRFPKRTKGSEGTIGDREHATRPSEHNADIDGSVDAWDMDVNILGSSDEYGSDAELHSIEALKADFQKEPGAQLWIHRGFIANKDIHNWRRRVYPGSNKHMKHVHWQSDGDGERKAFTGDLFDDVVTAVNHPERTKPAVAIPAWPHRTAHSFGPEDGGHVYRTVYRAQSRLRERGWRITVDGRYGPKTASVVKAYQREKGLAADGRLGPNTWRSLWAAPVTG